jgi:hypothetical protein
MRVVQIADFRKNRYGVPRFTPWAVRDSATLRCRRPNDNNEPQSTAAQVDVRALGESSKHDKTPKSEISHSKRLATQPSPLIPQ